MGVSLTGVLFVALLPPCGGMYLLQRVLVFKTLIMNSKALTCCNLIDLKAAQLIRKDQKSNISINVRSTLTYFIFLPINYGTPVTTILTAYWIMSLIPKYLLLLQIIVQYNN